MKPKVITYGIFLISLWLVFIGDQRNGWMTGFLVMGGLLLASLIRDHWIRAFYLWGMLQVIFVLNIFAILPSPEAFKLYTRSLDAMVLMTAGMIVYIWASKIKKSSFEHVFNVLCIFTLLQCAVYIFQLFGLDVIKYAVVIIQGGYAKENIWPAGTLGNKNFLASAIAICLPFFLRKKWALCLILVVPVFLSLKTATSIIAIGVGLTYWAIKNAKIWWLLGIILACVASLIFYEPLSLINDGGGMAWRFEIWERISHTWKHILLLGAGIGSFSMYFRAEHCHNEYINALFEGGVFVGILIIGYCMQFFRWALYRINRNNILLCTAIIIVAINCMGGYLFHIAPTAFISLLLMGMYDNGRISHLR
jgi:hypothetical protein